MKKAKPPKWFVTLMENFYRDEAYKIWCQAQEIGIELKLAAGSGKKKYKISENLKLRHWVIAKLANNLCLKHGCVKQKDPVPGRR